MYHVCLEKWGIVGKYLHTRVTSTCINSRGNLNLNNMSDLCKA